MIGVPGARLCQTPINQQHNTLLGEGWIMTTEWLGAFTKYRSPTGREQYLFIAYHWHRKVK